MNTILKQNVIGIFLLLIGSTACASIVVNDAVLMATKKFSSSQVKNLTVNTSGGSIEVNGNGGNETTVEMHVRPNNNRNLSKSEIQEILDRDYEISIEQKGNTVEAIAKRKNQGNWRNALNVSFRVKTGKNVASNLKTSGGSINIANLIGNQDFQTSGGSLKVNNIQGNIEGQTSGGSITAENLNGDVHLTTSGGSIRLTQLSGKIDVRTSGGSINGKSIDGSLHASTSGGSINLDNLNCALDASTSGGSVNASLVNLPGDVNLSTSAGTVNLTIPRNSAADLNLRGMRVNADNLNNFNGTNSEGKLIGSINGGGKEVSASTSAGSVNLRVN